ncbi:MAG: DnaJ domain-containing protein [Planctomycetota bacterium]
MQGWPWQKKARSGSPSWRERRSPRYRGETVRCALGTILDISATGMRVLCDGKPPVQIGGAMPIRLKFDDGSLQIGTQIRWCKRRGLKRYEIGLQFIQLKPGMEKVLEAIARFGMAGAAKHMEEGRPHSTGSGARQKREKSRVYVEGDLPDYFGVLDLQPDATTDQIKASYRRLATIYHPDRSDAPEAMKRFEEINEAYHVLCDPKRRETYLRMAV